MTKQEKRLIYINPSAMAYRDLCRTIRTQKGAKSQRGYVILKELSIETIELIDTELKLLDKITSQDSFNDWHDALCIKIKDKYNSDDGFIEIYNGFTYGQAQKWVNMTLKNTYLLCDMFDDVYKLFHIPVDSIIVESVSSELKIDAPTNAWSKWDNPVEYKNYQKCIRDMFPRDGYVCPLDWEYDAWRSAKGKQQK